jgi:hypothetical protein
MNLTTNVGSQSGEKGTIKPILRCLSHYSTSEGDFPGNPFGSIANYDVDRSLASKGILVHLHCLDSFKHTHSMLVTLPDTVEVRFKINAGGVYTLDEYSCNGKKAIILDWEVQP